MDMSAYTTAELANAVDLDCYAVRAEAQRRADKAARAMARANRAIKKAALEIESCNAALNAANQWMASQ